MAYIAVNKSGEGIICELPLIRFINNEENHKKGFPHNCYSIRDMQEENHWIPDLSFIYKTVEEQVAKCPKLGIMVNMIKTSPEVIRKLAGMDLTWEDEPIQI